MLQRYLILLFYFCGLVKFSALENFTHQLNDYRIFFNNVPKFLASWGETRRISFYWIYNPSIAHKFENVYYIFGRMSWQYGTNCSLLKNDSTSEHSCVLCNGDKWRDTSVFGEYNSNTCSTDILERNIFSDSMSWLNGSGWYDTKLMSIYPKFSGKISAQPNPIDSSIYMGPELWISSQKKEYINIDEGYVELQMQHVAYYDHNGVMNLSRAIYYDADKLHWSINYTRKSLKSDKIDLYRYLTRLCDNRPNHLPPLPIWTRMTHDANYVNNNYDKNKNHSRKNSMIHQNKFANDMIIRQRNTEVLLYNNSPRRSKLKSNSTRDVFVRTDTDMANLSSMLPLAARGSRIYSLAERGKGRKRKRKRFGVGNKPQVVILNYDRGKQRGDRYGSGLVGGGGSVDRARSSRISRVEGSGELSTVRDPTSGVILHSGDADRRSTNGRRSAGDPILMVHGRAPREGGQRRRLHEMQQGQEGDHNHDDPRLEWEGRNITDEHRGDFSESTIQAQEYLSITARTNAKHPDVMETNEGVTGSSAIVRR